MPAATLIDPVTGLFDRRRFIALAEQEVRRALRYRHPLTIVALALDGLPGEEQRPDRESAFRLVGSMIGETVREHDVLAHLGDGVFALALTETGEAGADVVAKRLAERIGASHMPGEKGNLRLSARVAVTACRPEEEAADQALERSVGLIVGSPVAAPVDHHIEQNSDMRTE